MIIGASKHTVIRKMIIGATKQTVIQSNKSKVTVVRVKDFQHTGNYKYISMTS